MNSVRPINICVCGEGKFIILIRSVGSIPLCVTEYQGCVE